MSSFVRPSFTSSWVLAWCVIFALALCSSSARADPAPDPACEGIHGLWSPLPDACLEVIDTDRPHQTDTPHVLAAGHTQIESALGALRLGGILGAQPGQRAPQVAFFDDNYKFGLVSRTDLQLIFTHAVYDAGQQRFTAPGPLNVRAKLNIIEENGWVPALTLVPTVFLPVAPSQTLRAGPLVFWGWELPLHLELEVNAGVLFSAKPLPADAVVLASALTYTVVGEFRIFVDVYATGWNIALGTGALWAFARDMQIDLGTYIGLSGDEPVATPFLGFSIRK